jgi:hypothetical protein
MNFTPIARIKHFNTDAPHLPHQIGDENRSGSNRLSIWPALFPGQAGCNPSNKKGHAQQTKRHSQIIQAFRRFQAVGANKRPEEIKLHMNSAIRAKLRPDIIRL